MMQPGGAKDYPARCRTCGAEAESEKERRHHEQKTGHRIWQLLVRKPEDGALLTRG